MTQDIERGAYPSGEEGSALLVVLVLLVLVTVICISAMNSSVTELKIAGNDRVSKRNFYNAEAGLFDAVAMFDRIYANEADSEGNRLYLKDSTHLPLRDRDPRNGGVEFASPVTNDAGIPVAWIEVRAILLLANKQASTLSAAAEDIPSLAHIGPAPKGSEKGVYRTRRYAVTATAIDPTVYSAANPKASLTGVVLQCGVDMQEELVKVEHLQGI
ncbi:PilX N-terminal domain-containing pilus assembly protein [Desulfoluna butyratoxydans]|uniref:Type 4 fimbrial biogenesis protein pilx n-terminal domain n=1 Tax=Desulfoluna butyratoxydans TaxID=231438 RepID=A0A4U8YTE0_9BACT|nr:PilX N-terminal domain-containing pilus assembly protein [Desulfoluna butyratoxydans]VFQ45122.1 type 4 fimbrial biogenesis protein pilx n-terminal domain [Desulfoluna butyratoxydans]